LSSKVILSLWVNVSIDVHAERENEFAFSSLDS
jgi:hypothetical protein